MNKLSLRLKLGLGFGVLLLVLVAMGFIAYNAVGQLAEISNRADEIMTKKDMSSQIEGALEKQSTGIRGFLLSGKEDLLKHDQEGKQEFADNMDKLGKMLVTDEGKRLHSGISRNYDQFRAFADNEIQLRRDGKAKEAEELAFAPKTDEVRNQLRKAIADLVALEDKLKEEVVKEKASVESRVRSLVTVLATEAAKVATSAVKVADVITLMTWPISVEESPSLETVVVVFSATFTAEVATLAASVAFFAISLMLAPISSAPVATVCRFWLTACADLLTTSA